MYHLGSKDLSESVQKVLLSIISLIVSILKVLPLKILGIAPFFLVDTTQAFSFLVSLPF